MAGNGICETNDADPSSALFTKLEKLLEKQATFLEQQNIFLEKLVKSTIDIDGDLHGIPPVSARSSSAWNPLLVSTLKNTALITSRWQGGLDTLLIFVGFFSAIVATFLVDSSKSLSLNDTVRTNELLMNLTEIILFINSETAGSMPLSRPMPFVPDPADVRINVYWSMSLMLSILAAVLAVAGKVFLSLLIKSEGDAATRLTEVYRRRSQAIALLGPCLEALPQFLILPFVFFIIGLLDNLLSSSISDVGVILPTYISSVIACFLVASVGIVLTCALAHGVIHHSTSPFQSLLSQYILRRKSSQQHILDEFKEGRSLTEENREVFHLVVQETFEDEALDQASTALYRIIIGRSTSFGLTEQEIQTILHLLSSEASLRSNLSAARVIVNLSSNSGLSLSPACANLFNINCISLDARELRYPLCPQHRAAIMLALSQAADRHQTNRPHLVQWHQNSPFVSAMASVIPSSSIKYKYPHPLIAILATRGLDPWRELPAVLGKASISLVWHAVSTFTCNLTSYTGEEREHQLRDTVSRLLGGCSVDPQDGAALLLSLTYFKFTFSELKTSSRDMNDYNVIVQYICQWLAGGTQAADTFDLIIRCLLRPYFRHRLHRTVVDTVLEFLLYKTQEFSVENLMLCGKFFFRVRGTLLWDAARPNLFRVIIRFLDLLEQNRDSPVGIHEGRRWNICRETLNHLYLWAVLHRRAPGVYGCVDLPSAGALLGRLNRMRKEFLNPWPAVRWQVSLR